jgi:hypothetical protein
MTQPKPIDPIIGTDELERPFTEAERDYAQHLLHAHDFPGARRVALKFAYSLTHNIDRAKEVVGRASLRLVRQGWDPNKVTLVRAMCRFTWSEFTHLKDETKAAKAAEERYLKELEATEGLHSQSVEESMERLDAERREEARAMARIAELRAAFVEADDAVNLIWLEMSLEGVEDPNAMAQRSGRDVKEFYRATDRRKRHVRRLAGAPDGGKDQETE